MTEISQWTDSEPQHMPRRAHIHIPTRMCCICRKRLPKPCLGRYVGTRNSEGRPVLTFDSDQILPGRGFYVCSDPGCQRAMSRYKGWQKKWRGES